MSVYTTVFAGSTPLGGLFSGTLATLGGVTVALVAGGVLTVLTALAAASRVVGRGPLASRSVAGQEVGPG